MPKRERCGFKKQIRGRFCIFHIADACYNFHDKILDLSETKTEEKNQLCLTHQLSLAKALQKRPWSLLSSAYIYCQSGSEVSRE